ncbi:MAG: hypothetical protein JWN03_7912 [Nocardia sp.]|uniref:hypothetical protein n=1 Tax=Nocardia sp. TaxID=1821 RepID=UPI0026272CD5|nr:hypothetical protein [Nocardia sp.]MCU1647637.1 hypothetical protein [Nocardia sp.]
MSATEVSEVEAPLAIESDDPEGAAVSAEVVRKTLKDKVSRLCIALLSIIIVLGAAVGAWSMDKHHAVDRSTGHDQGMLQFSMDAVAQLISTNSADPNGYVDRVLANATGQWHDEFDARKRSVVDTMQASGGITTGHGIAAGIERRNDDQSVTVLVVATGESSVPVPQGNSAPAEASPGGMQVKTEPKQYQLRVDVAEVGGKFKLSKVVFVQ